MRSINQSDRARAIAVQPDGKIVLGGQTDETVPAGRAILNRLNPDGSLDTSFGTGGRVISDVMEQIGGVAILPDGKILAAGGIRDASPISFTVARFEPDGSVDTSFGVGGYAKLPAQNPVFIWSAANALVIQPDGKIVAGGFAIVNPGGSRYLLARFNPDGSLDAGFGAGGAVQTRFTNGETTVLALALQSDGKIVAGGYNVADQVTRNFSLARYNPDGAIDLDFGLEGQVTTNFAFHNFAMANALVIQPDGKMIAAGGFTRQSTGFLLARYKADGRLDSAFGSNGKVMTGFASGGTGYGNAALLQPDGKLLVAGAIAYSGINNSFLLARYDPDGSFDQTFGQGGVVISPQEAGFDEAFALAFYPGGRVIAAGNVDEPSHSYTDFAAARYFIGPAAANARTPFDFDGDSRADVSIYRGGDWYLEQSGAGFTATHFGLASDIIVPADFDGDGKADIAVFRPSSGDWFRIGSASGAYSGEHFGASGDLPVPGDYDGDGRADYAVYRAGTWYISGSTAGFRAEQFGLSTDRPAPADFDGDGKTDPAVYRDGDWYIDATTRGFTALHFGVASDMTVAADYDGDRKTDIAVWRPAEGNWYILRSSDGGFAAFHWGMQGDMPVPADYDGDGKADPAIFRGGGEWWMMQSASGGYTSEAFGLSGDMPVPYSCVR